MYTEKSVDGGWLDLAAATMSIRASRSRAPGGPLEPLGMEKVKKTAPMELAGCTINCVREAKSGFLGNPS
jgi:hypothetical protein